MFHPTNHFNVSTSISSFSINRLIFCLIIFSNFILSEGTIAQLSSQVEVSTIATLTAPDGIARDDFGNLYASRYTFTGLGAVFKIDRNQNISTFVNNQPWPAGLLFAENVLLYLTRYDNNDIVQISPDGVLLDTIATGMVGPIGLDFDSQGNLYGNNHTAFHITRIDTAGNQSSYVNHSRFNTSSLTFDDQDIMYISRYLSPEIVKVTPSQTPQAETFVNLPIQGGVGFIIYSGNYLYATAINDDMIMRISLSGEIDTLAGSGIRGHLDGSGDIAHFHTPNGIVASENGDTLWVAEGGGFIRMITNISTAIPAADASVPAGFTLAQNFPNPFNPSTAIHFNLPKAGFTTLKIYNALGEEIATLLAETLPAGNHAYQWQARDFSSGIYFYQLNFEGHSLMKRAVLLK